MPKTALALGTFDGVHFGHRKILKTAVKLARKMGLVPAVFTFSRPPRQFFAPSSEPYLLTTPAEKFQLFKESGIKKVFIRDFNSKVANVPALSFFLNTVVNDCDAKAVVAGYNFSFGKGRAGNTELLRQWGKEKKLAVKIVPQFVKRNTPVSSGRIRKLLIKNRLAEANGLLGAAYRVTGKVVPGRRLGKKLGFPTANLLCDPEKILPRGVFAVRCRIMSGKLSKKWKGMCNIGVRPTLSGSKKLVTVEAHLFGFKGNLYGKILCLELIHRLRNEKKFKNVGQLERQLKNDRRKALWLL